MPRMLDPWGPGKGLKSGQLKPVPRAAAVWVNSEELQTLRAVFLGGIRAKSESQASPITPQHRAGLRPEERAVALHMPLAGADWQLREVSGGATRAIIAEQLGSHPHPL